MNIGLSGKLRAGKDTAAAYLMRRLIGTAGTRTPRTLAFAGRLKELCTQLEGRGAFRYAHDFLVECMENELIVAPDLYPLAHDLVELAERYEGQSVGGKNRELLQAVGQLCCEKIDCNVWVNTVLSLHAAQSDRHTTIVTDCRKPYEAEALHAAGFVVLRIDVDPAIQEARVLAAGGKYSPAIISHITETWLDDYADFDARIANNGSLEELYIQLDCFVRAHTWPMISASA